MLKYRINTYVIFVYFVLFTSFLHAVVRPSPTSSLSLFRFLLPILLISLLLKNGNYLKYLIYLLIFFVFNFVLAFLYTNNYTHFFVFSIHYLCIFTIFIAINYLIDNENLKSIYSFLKFSLYLFIVIWFIEIILNFDLPNVGVYYDGSRSSVFWIQNEFGTAILGFFPFLLVFGKRMQKVFFFLIAFFINYHDDSKMALIGLIVAVIVYFIMKFNCESRIYVLNFSILILVLSLSIFSHFIFFDFRDYKISLFDLMADPIEHIITLKPYSDNGGSIETRTNAAVYAIQTLNKSHFIGIGLGNTLTMLEKPEFHLKTAKSIHNLPLQLIVENGIIAIFLFIYLIKRNLEIFYKGPNSKTNKLFIIVFFSYLFGSLSSSVGIFSNYFFISTLAFTILLNIKKNTITSSNLEKN